MSARSVKQQMKDLGGAILTKVLAAARTNLDAAGKLLVTELRRTMGAPARVVTGPRGGVHRVPASPGAPMRSVSGKAARAVTHVVAARPGGGYVLTVTCPAATGPDGFPYAWFHDTPGVAAASGRHPYTAPTLARCWRQVVALIGRGVGEG